MYSSAKKMATLSAVACAINFIGLIMFIMMSNALKLSFAMNFALFMVMISGSVISLCLTISMRSICLDLQYEFEDQAKKLREINQKIKEIESKK